MEINYKLKSYARRSRKELSQEITLIENMLKASRWEERASVLLRDHVCGTSESVASYQTLPLQTKENKMEPRPLMPLSHGNVLIVGAKSSNFHEEIRTHPRVTIWDSQNKSWSGKELPSNIRAIFITRFIGHADFKNIIAEARKKKITIFNPEGTGLIARQVKELLDMPRPREPWLITDVPPPIVEAPVSIPILPTAVQLEPKDETMMPKVLKNEPGKLKVLYQYIDWTKTNVDNARVMLEKAKEHGVSTTLASLANSVATRRKQTGKYIRVPATVRESERPEKLEKTTKQPVDASVDILDEMIRGLKDIREFLVATTDENRVLRARLDKFKRFLEEG